MAYENFLSRLFEQAQGAELKFNAPDGSKFQIKSTAPKVQQAVTQQQPQVSQQMPVPQIEDIPHVPLSMQEDQMMRGYLDNQVRSGSISPQQAMQMGMDAEIDMSDDPWGVVRRHTSAISGGLIDESYSPMPTTYPQTYEEKLQEFYQSNPNVTPRPSHGEQDAAWNTFLSGADENYQWTGAPTENPYDIRNPNNKDRIVTVNRDLDGDGIAEPIGTRPVTRADLANLDPNSQVYKEVSEFINNRENTGAINPNLLGAGMDTTGGIAGNRFLDESAGGYDTHTEFSNNGKAIIEDELARTSSTLAQIAADPSSTPVNNSTDNVNTGPTGQQYLVNKNGQFTDLNGNPFPDLDDRTQDNFAQKALDLFGFNSRDIARLLLYSAVGMATGGSTGGSFNWAARKVLQDADARSAAQKKSQNAMFNSFIQYGHLLPTDHRREVINAIKAGDTEKARIIWAEAPRLDPEKTKAVVTANRNARTKLHSALVNTAESLATYQTDRTDFRGNPIAGNWLKEHNIAPNTIADAYIKVMNEYGGNDAAFYESPVHNEIVQATLRAMESDAAAGRPVGDFEQRLRERFLIRTSGFSTQAAKEMSDLSAEGRALLVSKANNFALSHSTENAPLKPGDVLNGASNTYSMLPNTDNIRFPEFASLYFSAQPENIKSFREWLASDQEKDVVFDVNLIRSRLNISTN